MLGSPSGARARQGKAAGVGWDDGGEGRRRKEGKRKEGKAEPGEGRGRLRQRPFWRSLLSGSPAVLRLGACCPPLGHLEGVCRSSGGAGVGWGKARKKKTKGREHVPGDRKEPDLVLMTPPGTGTGGLVPPAAIPERRLRLPGPSPASYLIAFLLAFRGVVECFHHYFPGAGVEETASLE